MEGLFSWIKNITYYLIFMTVVVNILPDKKYEKYIKLFAGMVLVLLVLYPLARGLRLEDKIAYFFEHITFQEEASELRGQLSAMDEKRVERMIQGYEEAIAQDISVMAEGAGFCGKEIRVTLEQDQEKETFGAVTYIFMRITTAGQEGGNSLGGDSLGGNPPGGDSLEGGAAGSETLHVEQIEQVEAVEPVTIGGDSQKPVKEDRLFADTAVNKLRKQIGDYYNLEEENIEIQLEDE